MTHKEESIQEHYSKGNLGESILAALKEMEVDVNQLTHTDLAPVDGFHIRGREATIELANAIQLNPDHKVLDAGCGIGGSARYLASEYGCHVTGIDLTREYIEVAAMLSDLVNLTSLNEFHCGSALYLPFEDNSYDVVWTEHAQMNIADKPRFYSEIFRVLKPGGHFLFHDFFKGHQGAVQYPVPWAAEESISFLTDPGSLQELLKSIGFETDYWEDKTGISGQWLANRMSQTQGEGPSPLGLHILMGISTKARFGNLLSNLQERTVEVVQAVLKKA